MRAELKEYQAVEEAAMNVGGCHACETCYKTGKACSFDDDFNLIAPVILGADVVVFSMPVYWYSIPAQIKAVIDKIYSFCIAGKDIAGKRCSEVTEETLTVTFLNTAVLYLRTYKKTPDKMKYVIVTPGGTVQYTYRL